MRFRDPAKLFIVYELGTWSRGLNVKSTLYDCLFGAVKLTKNGDPDKHGYSSYGTGLDSCSDFSINGEFGYKVCIHESSAIIDSNLTELHN